MFLLGLRLPAFLFFFFFFAYFNGVLVGCDLGDALENHSVGFFPPCLLCRVALTKKKKKKKEKLRRLNTDCVLVTLVLYYPGLLSEPLSPIENYPKWASVEASCGGHTFLYYFVLCCFFLSFL